VNKYSYEVIVSPIDYRYGREEVKRIFCEEQRIHYLLMIEAAASQAEAEFNLIPKEAFESISNAVKSGKVKVERIKEIEKETKHDMMALIRALGEVSGSGSSYVHFGLTSNDIIDTATALQLKDFYSVLVDDLLELQDSLVNLVEKYSNAIMIGRTHGQHASPITFGLKMSVYLSEVNRHIERVKESRKRVIAGKIMGPVGTGASLGDAALEIQDRVMEILGIFPETASSQIVNRDRYVEYSGILAGIATSLEKFGTEVRNLQRPEIGEVSEYFNRETQVGSSAMPSKVNPINSENVCSLARLVRSFAVPEMEGAVTWHERDLTNSALERFTIPYMSILTDYILRKMADIFETLVVNTDKMRENVLKDDYVMSENVVTVLTRNGYERLKAHELVRKSSMDGYSSGMSLRESLIKNGILDILSPSEFEDAMNPENFTGKASEICRITVTASRRIRTEAYNW
jgi:adenylosuccinate lyase